MPSAAAGIVLVGGRSSRMGTAKADLEWHGSTLLYRTAALLTRTVFGPIVVVTAPDQDVGELPVGVATVPDPIEGLGPLQGIAAGLAAVADRAPTAFVCGTDLPFLHPAFVRRVLRALDSSDAEVALPVVHGFRQPLAAAYRTALAGRFAEMIIRGQRRLGALEAHCAVTPIGESTLLADPELARLDPQLDSVINVNTAEEYAAARRRPPAEVLVLAGTDQHRVRAATLGATGLAPSAGVLLNGSPVPDDPRLPLVAGDRITLIG